MYFDLSNHYNIQIISPLQSNKKSKSKSDLSNNIFINNTFSSSPRVGLTLNTKNLNPIENSEKDVYNSMLRLKEEYVMAPYRFIRMNNSGNLKKYKALIGLSMAYGYCNYYKYMSNRFDKIIGNGDNNDNSDNSGLSKPNDDIVMQVYDATRIKTKSIDDGIKECEKGRKTSKKVLIDGRKWSKMGNAQMQTLFGACIEA